MSVPARLVIVRHAESRRNLAKNGRVFFADDATRQEVRGTPEHLVELTDAGHAQAVETGIALRERHGTFDCVYTSGYVRTVQTTEGLLRAYDDAERDRMPVRMSVFVRERDPGFTYDMTEAEVDTAFPWLEEYWRTFGGFMARPPGGESLADVVTRVHTFLELVSRDHAGRDVLVVTHGGTIRCVRFVLENWTYAQAERWPPGEEPANCGVTTYRCEGDRLELERYNDVYWGISRT